jgi:LacI family transcriptional regulator
MEEILGSRGIPGILVSPLGRNESVLDFCFARFSAVTFGYSLECPRLHRVSYHQLSMMEGVFRRLHDLGCRRPGLATCPGSDRRAGRAWSAGFRNEQHRFADVVHIPPLLAESSSREVFLAWFRQWEPDVILTPEASRLDWLVEAGVAVPGDTGFCLLSVPPPGKEFCAGCQEDPARVGTGAVDIRYIGQQWQVNTGSADELTFQYSTDATSLTTGNWTTHDALTVKSVADSATGLDYQYVEPVRK